jgi:hypothetical protein
MFDENPLFRYSVKCTRVENALIERLAKRDGVSPNAFVQRHFEDLWKKAAPLPPPEPKYPKMLERVESLNKKQAAKKLVEMLHEVADENGLVAAGYGDIGAWIGRSEVVARTYMLELIAQGVVTVHSRPQPGMPRGTPSVYHIVGPPG